MTNKHLLARGITILCIVVNIYQSMTSMAQPIEIIEQSKTTQMKNIPDNFQHNLSIDDLLNELAKKKHSKCKANVLYHPKRSLFYFNNPVTQIPNQLSSYIPLKCTVLSSYISWSKAQRVYFPFKDIEQILDNNEDSILQNVLQEITNLQKGIEVSFFPVHFYKKSEVNIKNDKMFVCYDSIKVLGFDKSNCLYFLITAGDYYDIIHCDSNKTVLGNLIRYSTYCHELCNEDYIYYSNDLIKCKCEFHKDKNNNALLYNNHPPLESESNKKSSLIHQSNNSPLSISKPNELKVSLILDKYSAFANRNELIEKKLQYSYAKLDVSYIRFYFHLFSMIASIQIVYVFLIKEKSNTFIKFNMIFYVFVLMFVYFAFCIKSWSLTSPLLIEYNFVLFKQISDVIEDIYPLVVLVYLAFKHNSLNNSNTQINSNRFKLYWPMILLTIIMLMNSLDYVLRDVNVNEIDIVFKGILIILLMFIKNTEPYSYMFCLMFQMKTLLSFISQISLFSIEKSIMPNITVPLFIIFGKNKDNSLYSSKFIFQANYVKLYPYFTSINENWFMEALNFSRQKDIIILMQYIRYFVLVYLSHCVLLCDCGLINLTDGLLHLNFSQIVSWNIQIALKVPLLGKKKISLLFFIFMISNVLCTYDCMWLYLVHCVIGLLYRWLVLEKKFDCAQLNKDTGNKKVLTSRNFRLLSRLNLVNDLVIKHDYDIHSD